ncbi:RWD domain-containing protein [Hirsutella rhossiliensis]|uniref:RWD domain-containing protein n=1 Tax=Hirsutella rhossiliensis TaxID=111463 RepID=A0A9P8N225_9HYPO|nr:RWD domain-containing protein [Hirsutella rhossiliensis]KAH0965182.1 RWD domain-containing protein [Hirsutella rhossiliensis]
MSDELTDEIEAINSIYGADTLRLADDDGADGDEAGGGGSVHVLQLPGGASWLRLRFPAAYPGEPPAVLGTQRSSGGVRGAGARDLGLFREALGEVFESGTVCVFDAVEEFAQDAGLADEEERRGQSREGEAVAGEHHGQPGVEHGSSSATTTETDYPPPIWTVSEPVTENKSTFIAHVTRVTSPAQARAHIAHLLASDRRLRTATHNMTAWRVRGPNHHSSSSSSPNPPGGGGMHDCDDDGESAAGARLLHLMHLMGLWDALVVVSRWYGGVKLGPRRFAVINAVARDGFVRAGMVAEREKEKERGKKAR